MRLRTKSAAAASATAAPSQKTLAHRREVLAGGSTFTKTAARQPMRSMRRISAASSVVRITPSGRQSPSSPIRLRGAPRP